MPTTATRSSPKLAATDFRRGMSVAHGTHHEAQKSSTIADVPSYDATANGVPSNVVARNGGTHSVASPHPTRPPPGKGGGRKTKMRPSAAHCSLPCRNDVSLRYCGADTSYADSNLSIIRIYQCTMQKSKIKMQAFRPVRRLAGRDSIMLSRTLIADSSADIHTRMLPPWSPAQRP